MKLPKTMMCMTYLIIVISGVNSFDEKLVFSTSTRLKEIDLRTKEVRTLANLTTNVYSVAYDYRKKNLYVPRRSSSEIVRFPYPINQTVIIEPVVSAYPPLGMAFDSVNSHLYWAEDKFTGRIMRCNSDGSEVTSIFNATQPSALTLDIKNRWIYYSQQLGNSSIFRINFDGTDKREIIQNLPTYVFGVEVDIRDKRLYWMEHKTGDLKSAWYSGSDIKTIISTHTSGRNWDIDIDEDFVFFSSNNQILKIKKSLGLIPSVVRTDTSQINAVWLYQQEWIDCDENEQALAYTYEKIRRTFLI